MQTPRLWLDRAWVLALMWAPCVSVYAQTRKSSPDPNDGYAVLAGIAIVALLALLVFVGWVWCLVSAAKNGKWVWFVLMLLFQVLFIFYLLFADKRPPSPPSSPSPYGRREPYLDR